MTLRKCNTCHQHIVNTTLCPTCHSPKEAVAVPGRALLISALLGFGLTACGEKDEDTSSEPSSETEPSAEAMYGVPEESPEEGE